MKRRVPSILNPGSRIYILGEAPGEVEDNTGEPFKGPSGQIINSIFEDLGVPEWRKIYSIGNVYGFRPPYNNLKRVKEVCDPDIEHSRARREIETINPNLILALGATALKFVTGRDGIQNWRGSIISSRWGTPKVVSSIHPANITRAGEDHDEEKGTFPYIYRTILKLDIKRAIDESVTRELNLPSRLLRVCNDSLTLYRFIRDGISKGQVWADIETYNSTLPVCVSLAFNRHSAISIPLVRRVRGKIKRGKKIYPVEYKICDRTDSESAELWRQLDELFRTTPVCGQNFKFDKEKLELIGFKFKGVKSDTVVKAHVVNPELPKFSLGFLGSIWTREPFYKEEGKEFVYGRDPIENLLIYNARDSAVDCEIDEELDVDIRELSEQFHLDLMSYFDYKMKLYPIYEEMEKIGFRMDEPRSKELKAKYEVALKDEYKELIELIGYDVNPNSWQQVSQLLYNDLKLIKPYTGKKTTSGTEEKVLTKLLNKLKNDRNGAKPTKIIDKILRCRKQNKTISVYIDFKRDYDGRGRSNYRQAGTETGRSSTSILKEPVRKDKTGFAFQTLTKHGDIGADIRSQFIPDDGFVYVNIDKSQAEVRVVCVLSQNYKFLERMNKVDTHRRVAAFVLGYCNSFDILSDTHEIADGIGKDSPDRFIGKKVKHAHAYGMKKFECAGQINKEARKLGLNVDISEWKAGNMLERMDIAMPEIKGIFHRDIIDCLHETRTLITPFGRPRQFFERFGEQLYKEGFADIPQSTVSDDLKHGMIRVDEWRRQVKAPIKVGMRSVNGFAFNGEAHDANLFQMPKNEYLDICKEIKPLLETPIDFNLCSLRRNYKLVIPVDFEVAFENYKDFQKFKVEENVYA